MLSTIASSASCDDLLLNGLKQLLGSTAEFRPHQLEVCSCILQGKDAFVLMATGAGKSIAFQLPAIVLRDRGEKVTTVVISPLISLIEDQVNQLNQLGVNAGVIGSNATLEDEAAARRGEFTILYTTPEKMLGWKTGFLEMIGNTRLLCIAVDECHCVSEWGHDFRTAYRSLSSIRQWGNNNIVHEVPIVALTATATATVRNDIIMNLQLRQPYIVTASFNRPNIKYYVCNRTNVFDLIRLVLKLRQIQLENVDKKAYESTRFPSIIIYANTKKDTEEVVEAIKNVKMKEFKGLKIAYYHANLSAADRMHVHHGFMSNEIQIIVATIAFGMGINKADVRAVIHYRMPQTVEAYYQQTGRAGRDDLPAACYLMYNRSDMTELYNIVSRPTSINTGGIIDGIDSGVAGSNYANYISKAMKQLQVMNEYISGSCACRRRYILSYFGESLPSTGSDTATTGSSASVNSSTNALTRNCCDLCDAATMTDSDTLLTEVGREVHLLLQAIVDCGQCYGIARPVLLLLGSHDKKLQQIYNYSNSSVFGLGINHSKEWWKALCFQLANVNENMVESTLVNSTKGFYSYEVFKVSGKGSAFLNECDIKFNDSDDGSIVSMDAYTVTSAQYALVPNPDFRAYIDAEVQRKKVPIITRIAPTKRSNDCTSTVDTSNTAAIPSDEASVYKLNDAQRSALVTHLLVARTRISEESGLNPYSIISSAGIDSLVDHRPMTLSHLMGLPHWNAASISRFGLKFIGEVKDFSLEHGIPDSEFVRNFTEDIEDDVCDTVDTAEIRSIGHTVYHIKRPDYMNAIATASASAGASAGATVGATYDNTTNRISIDVEDSNHGNGGCEYVVIKKFKSTSDTTTGGTISDNAGTDRSTSPISLHSLGSQQMNTAHVDLLSFPVWDICSNQSISSACSSCSDAVIEAAPTACNTVDNDTSALAVHEPTTDATNTEATYTEQHAKRQIHVNAVKKAIKNRQNMYLGIKSKTNYSA